MYTVFVFQIFIYNNILFVCMIIKYIFNQIIFILLLNKVKYNYMIFKYMKQM